MPLSRDATKELIFDTLAEHFEKTGETTCVTVAQIVEKTGDKEDRIQSLFDEVVSEGVIHNQECEDPKGYRFTPMTYMQVVMMFEAAGRLHPSVIIERGGGSQKRPSGSKKRRKK